MSVEPRLQPLNGECLPSAANKEDEAGLDVRAKGFWNNQPDAFLMSGSSTHSRPDTEIPDLPQFTVNTSKENVWSTASELEI